MDVTDGANLHLNRTEIAELLATPLRCLAWVASFNGQHVICDHVDSSSLYYLVQSNADVQHALAARCGVVSDLADELLGFVTVDHGELDTVVAAWLAPCMRGKGYGEGLHRLAYQMSENGICSSDDIGTMSLATLIRLYQKELKMDLVYRDEIIPRDQVRIHGTIILHGKLNLCSWQTGDFRFEWRK